MKTRQNRRNARSLSQRAGFAAAQDTHFEMLEERRLLFSLTISAEDDPDGDGVGSITTTFGYTIPVLDSSPEVSEGDPEAIDEDFNDEAQGPVATGNIFADSNIRVTHNFGFNDNFRLSQPIPDEEDELELDVRASNGSIWTFEPLAVDDDTGAVVANIAAIETSFTILDRGDGVGLLPSGFEVDILFFDEVTATYTGNELIDRNTSGNPADLLNGIGTFVFDADDTTQEALTGIRIRSLVDEDLTLDNLQFLTAPGLFADIISERIFGAELRFTAPVGATVEVFDLYGRDMVNTLALGQPDGIDLNLVDLDDNGVPNFNDGIGSIRFSNVDHRASFAMFGGTIDYDEGFVYTRVDNFQGLFDVFEGAGFGYLVEYDDSGQPTVFGLPEGPGSVIVGSPYVRPNFNSGTYDPAGLAGNDTTVTDVFNDPDQGIFVVDGSSMGEVYVHGVLHGSSRFTGAVESMYVGYLAGSLTVDGDLGTLYVGSEAGIWVSDEDADTDVTVQTGGQLTVGRTLGELSIGGRSLMAVTVVGDLNNPALRPPGEVYRYTEREMMGLFDDGDEEPQLIDQIISPITDFFGSGDDIFPFPNGRTPIYVDTTYRNDTLLSAEFVGGPGTAVEVAGTIGYGDTLNGEDPADIFAFAVDGTNAIDIQVINLSFPGYIRVLDQNGVPLAATVFDIASFGGFVGSVSQSLRFEPPAAGVYYLEISDLGVGLVNGINGDGWEYLATITGIAPVALGSYRTGASSGVSPAALSSVQVLTGDTGIFRTGVGAPGSDGQDRGVDGILNRPEDDEDATADLLGGLFSTPGDLYSFVTGSDVEYAELYVGGDLGAFYTGMSPVFGLSGAGTEGDIGVMTLQTGGRIGLIDIKGAVGINNDVDPIAFGGLLDIRTGTGGGDGSIGMIRVGGDINAGSILLSTSANSVVGGFLISQDIGDAGEGIYNGLYQVTDFNLGTGSDIRFVDMPRIDALNTVNLSFDLNVGEQLTFVDDAGGVVTIQVDGPLPGAFAGNVRVLPVDNGEGVAVATIDAVDLTGGRSLTIRSTERAFGSSDDAPISIGNIEIAAADATSQIDISGNIEIDVWRIASQAALFRISNSTPGGDIVAIDVAGLTNLEIEQGNLGYTEVPSYGIADFGLLLGVAVGEQTGIGDAVGTEASVLPEDTEDGFRPVAALDGLYLEDVGSPLDPYLNGIVVRGGDLDNVNVSGRIGDVILQGGGAIASIVADSDFIPGIGQIDGIFGSIYAQEIDNVDVGQGLVSTGIAPFATAGIFASDEIRNIEVDAVRHEGAFLSGVVIGSDFVLDSGDLGNLDVGGIENINVNEGVIRDSYIGSMNLDAFLTSYTGLGEIYTGTIGTITGTDLTIFRSRIEAVRINNLALGRGTFDATEVNVNEDLLAAEFRVVQNSTIGGGQFEFAVNSITSGNDVGTIVGESVNDLRLQVLGDVTGGITVDTIQRVEFIINGTVPRMDVTNQIVGSLFSLGRLEGLSANAIRTTEIEVSGEITSISAATEIYNTSIASTGGQGEIGSVSATDRIVGDISAIGPIGSITSDFLDIEVVTTSELGRVEAIASTGDLYLESSISAGVGSIEAGGTIGRPGEPSSIYVSGDLSSIVAGGHLYSDVRVGSNLVNAVIGEAVNRPGQPMALSGSIYAGEQVQSVQITGDFGGEIISYTNGVVSVEITGGSLLPTGGVSAYDGNIESLVISGGNLYGDIYTDESIVSLQVLPSADGIFGDIGVNPLFSAGVGYDAARGQLPPGVQQTAGKDGPNIVAEVNIESIVVSGGHVYETTFYAGEAVVSIDVSGGILSDFVRGNTGRSIIAAGDEIVSVTTTGNINNAVILAGVRSLGDDLDAGGFGDDADTTQSGHIRGLTVGGRLTNSVISAGMNAGSDRVYNTGDDLMEIGISSIANISVAGSGDGTTVFSDRLLAGALAGGKLTGGGTGRPVDNADIASSVTGTQLSAGVDFAFSTGAGEGTITYTGPGSVFFDAATSRVILSGTTSATTLIVVAGGSRVLTDFDIVSTEGASLGRVRVQAFQLLGDSDIVIDENLDRVEVGIVNGSGTIQAGATLASFISGPFVSGEVIARDANNVFVSGDFGDPDVDVRGEAIMSFVNLGSFGLSGVMRADVSARSSITSVNLPEGAEGALIGSGDSIETVTALSVSRTRITAGESLQTLDVTGDFTDSSVIVGGDLGDDAEIGGQGFDTDTVGAGTIGSITIGGDFIISDIVAGYLRGPDGFFGTTDDLLASGRSGIGSVDIGGTAQGSNLSSEDYRIASTGTMGSVTVGGIEFTGDDNLVVETRPIDPLPIQVVELDTRRDGDEYIADLTFNQAIDVSSLDRALSVSEVRGTGEIEIRLIQGVDYVIEYDSSTNVASVVFSRDVVNKDLPVEADQPGPGVYRFEIEAAFVRASAVLARLDGNGDGTTPAGDDYAKQNIIGDAGDLFEAESFEIDGRNGLPDAQVDLYAPIDLNVVLDDAFQSDGLADANETFTVRGAIGDHPDNDVDYFSFSSDVDLYQITLQAGQILQLSPMEGAARLVGRNLLQPDGSFAGGSTDFVQLLPAEPISRDGNGEFQVTIETEYLIRQTGTYFIVVGNTFAGTLVNVGTIPGGAGDYSFDLTVFDDGDTGFNAETNAGDGQDLVNAPSPDAFAGTDGILGTGDDAQSIVIGEYTFTFDAGADGIVGSADDFVVGGNSNGVSSITDALGAQTVSIESAIGVPGATGARTNFSPDVDIFHLNAGNTIQTGSVIRATLQLTDLGSDLGSFAGDLEEAFVVDSFVEFAVFDTTNSTGSDDALLLYAPTDISAIGGQTPGVISESNNVTYGYDDNGDFFIEFVAPGRLDLNGADASYALYVQGVFNTDYRVEVVTAGSRDLVQRRQNFVLETEGGSVDWLVVDGAVTTLDGFQGSDLGFTGRVENGQQVTDYIIDSVIDNVQGTFDNIVTGAGPDGVFGTDDDERGLDINISEDPADFEFQDFSTIFVSATLDPRDPIFEVDLFTGLLGGELDPQTYGAIQRSDPGNADRNDEAVVFITNLSVLDYTPAEIDSLVESLTAATLRSAGQLMGLRMTEAYDTTEDVFSVQAINSVEGIPGDAGQYEFTNGDRRLSPSSDPLDEADFFLGFQNSASLLNLYVR